MGGRGLGVKKAGRKGLGGQVWEEDPEAKIWKEM